MSDVRGTRIVRLIGDPAIGGDLLLVAVGLAAKYDFGLDYGGTISGLGELLWSTSDMSGYRVREAFRRDMRGYKPPPLDQTCCAPTARKPRCGKRTSVWGYATDWTTGEKRNLGGCRVHRQWYEEKWRENWTSKPEDPPLPCANHGGDLARHFPRIDWPGFWRKLDPNWVQHPEVKAWPKPTLTLVLGEGR